MKRTRFVNLIATLLLVLTTNTVATQAQQKKTNDNPSQAGKKEVGIVAHRGFHKYDGSAENSVYAMQLAVDHDFYGTEFDMQLTGDDVPVVFHDARLQGMAVGEVSHAQLMEHPGARLANGETIPTLGIFMESYAKAIRQQQDRGKATRLFFEIKPLQKAEKNELAAAMAKEYVERYGLQQQVCFISFSLDVCQALRAIMPDADIAYLGGDRAPRELKHLGINGIDYNYKTLLEHPHWVAEAHELGMTVNVWTVNDVKIALQMKELGVDLITTDLPLEMTELR